MTTIYEEGDNYRVTTEGNQYVFTKERVDDIERRYNQLKREPALPLTDTPEKIVEPTYISRTSIQHEMNTNKMENGKWQMPKDFITDVIDVSESVDDGTFLMDFLPQSARSKVTFWNEELRPIAVCKTCNTLFPYGSADGNCDACQMSERLKECDDMLCRCCNRGLNEREQGMVKKLWDLRKYCEKLEEIQDVVCFEGDVCICFEAIIAEDKCEPDFYLNLRKCYNLTTEDFKFAISVARNHLHLKDTGRLIGSSGDLMAHWLKDYLVNDRPMPIIDADRFVELKQGERMQVEAVAEELQAEAEKEADKKAKAAAKKAEQEAKKAAAKEKAKAAFNPPEYPPAQKIKCKGSAQMISNAAAQRAWLEKWAKDAWNGKDLWSAKTAKQYVTDKKNGVGTIFARAVFVEAVPFDGVEAEPIED